jgi:hypothetical protein
MSLGLLSIQGSGFLLTKNSIEALSDLITKLVDCDRGILTLSWILVSMARLSGLSFCFYLKTESEQYCLSLLIMELMSKKIIQDIVVFQEGLLPYLFFR